LATIWFELTLGHVTCYLVMRYRGDETQGLIKFTGKSDKWLLSASHATCFTHDSDIPRI